MKDFHIVTAPGARNSADASSGLPPYFAELQFQTVAESIYDYAVYMLDEHGRVVTWNAGAERIKGYKASEVIGRHFSFLYPAEAIADGRPARVLAQAVANGHYEDESWRVRKDGSRFWARATLTAVRDELGQLRGFVKITRDMTERRRLTELEASTHRLSVFIAMLAHELRNHLSPFRNVVNVLQSLPDLNADVAGCRDALDRQIGQMTRLVDDLVDVGRITAGKVALDERLVTVREVVNRGIESIQAKLSLRAQTIDVDLPAESIVLNADEERLVQVLHNLLDNASKFSARGSVITIKGTVEGEFAVLRIIDRGAGIPKASLGQIFEMFQQVNPAEPASSAGFGLGLALCKTFVQLHGGTISAESEGPGFGSTFIVQLPVAHHASTRAPTPSEHAPKVTTCLRIVVVDDNRDSADTLGILLKVRGHAPQIAYSATEGLKLTREYKPHLVFADLSMPEMDGFALLDALRKECDLSGITCVALSGHARALDRANTKRAGFDDHLVKPLDMSALDAVLHEVEQKLRSTH
ncbi:hybrid sensor histidine kinase/response regulator [Burkholderia cenocepacia]|uniref:hybrid sensor histidine kinase/response regulator n=1 Tax=Burkholderia cenocepacia TaxID=95486 RepID=UPI00222EB5CC|nr:ATP-binding protein [Burkholderia cenocepacia]MCW3609130.1 PAS domain S-box protein [Burkholderia cenocepacia]MCW5189855.1 PAS domain S-box protein [Burkholderia cenocepacia]